MTSPQFWLVIFRFSSSVRWQMTCKPRYYWSMWSRGWYRRESLRWLWSGILARKKNTLQQNQWYPIHVQVGAALFTQSVRAIWHEIYGFHGIFSLWQLEGKGSCDVDIDQSAGSMAICNAMVKSTMKSIYIHVAGFSFLSDIVYNLVQITTNG